MFLRPAVVVGKRKIDAFAQAIDTAQGASEVELVSERTTEARLLQPLRHPGLVSRVGESVEDRPQPVAEAHLYATVTSSLRNPVMFSSPSSVTTTSSSVRTPKRPSR